MKHKIVLVVALSLSSVSVFAEVINESILPKAVISQPLLALAKGSFLNPKNWSEVSTPGDIHKSGGSAFYESRFKGDASKLGYHFPSGGKDNDYWFYRGARAGTYLEPRKWGDYRFPGSIHRSGSGPYFESTFKGPGGSINFPVDGKDSDYWIYRGVSAAGSFLAPLNWSQNAIVGSIHRSGSGPYYESRFTGNASQLGYHFPKIGSDNEHWLYRGMNAGTYTQPRTWSEYAFVGSIHRSGTGPYYESRYKGPGATVNFPAEGQDNSSWIYRGKHAGTYSDPKFWSDSSYVGAIHRTRKGPLYESKVNGVNRANFPPVGTNNSHWNFKALHAGTYTDPQSMGETARVNAVFGRDVGARYESRFDGPTSAGRTPYPSPAERENQWWKLQALQCASNEKPLVSVRTMTRTLPVAPLDTTASRTIDIAGLVRGRSAVMNSELLANVRMPELELKYQDERHEVRSANLLDISKGHIVGEMIVITRDDGTFVSVINAPNHKGVLEGRANGVQTWLPTSNDDFMGDDAVIQEQISSRMASVNAKGSFDCDGKPVIDVLAGFSESSAAYVRDPYAFGLAQMETVNLGLRNSKVDVRLRLVGVQIISNDYGVNTNTLAQVGTLFSTGITQYGADMVAAFFYPAAGSTGGGWAYVPGRYSVNMAHAPTAFRHEMGHNAGGSHCNSAGSDDYRYGHARWAATRSHKTFLCGNNTSFYSTPLVFDEDGQPRGNAKTADMARLWRERAPIMSSYMEALTPVIGVIP